MFRKSHSFSYKNVLLHLTNRNDILANINEDLIFFFLSEGDDNVEEVEEQKAFIKKIHTTAINCHLNSFLKALTEAMSPNILENIKILLESNKLETTYQKQLKQNI